MKRLLLALLLVSCGQEEPPKGICVTGDKKEIFWIECEIATEELCQFTYSNQQVQIVNPNYKSVSDCMLVNKFHQLVEIMK